MERLDELPTIDESRPHPEEEDVIRKYVDPSFTFNKPDGQGRIESNDDDINMNWKLIGGTLLVFVVLNNPFVDQFLERFPLDRNAAFALKVVIMVLAVLGLHYFL